MSLRQHLEDLVDQGRSRLEKNLEKAGRPSNPPAIPHSSKPAPQAIPSTSKPASEPYYQPLFHPALPVSQNFTHELGAHGWGNNELQNYVSSPLNSFHSPTGTLVIRAIANSASLDNKYTSARLSSHQTLARPRGCLTVRLTAPCAEGVWPAFWLLPQDPFSWPGDGEVDIFESWNGDRVNHSCLHWGFFNGEDWAKHRVVDTKLENMMRETGCIFVFAWEQMENGEGRMVWWVEGKAVMKAPIPVGTRKMVDFRVLINVACGGNVCQGKVPRDGNYDLTIHELRFDDQPAGGWNAFESAWMTAPEGHTM